MLVCVGLPNGSMDERDGVQILDILGTHGCPPYVLDMQGLLLAFKSWQNKVKLCAQNQTNREKGKN